jgi:hypothetical protein
MCEQVVELEKLRRELAYRRQLNEQQNNMISQQRAQLNMGQEVGNRGRRPVSIASVREKVVKHQIFVSIAEDQDPRESGN